MCLAKVTEVYDNPCPMITDGWKEFSGQSKPQLQFKINGSAAVEFDKWMKATSEHAVAGITADDGNRYKPGFHVYMDEKDLIASQKRRVFIRNITCIGSQLSRRCAVAQEMYVPSDPDGWPPKSRPEGSGSGGTLKPPKGKSSVKGVIDKLRGMGVTPGQA